MKGWSDIFLPTLRAVKDFFTCCEGGSTFFYALHSKVYPCIGVLFVGKTVSSGYWSAGCSSTPENIGQGREVVKVGSQGLSPGVHERKGNAPYWTTS